MCRSGARTQQVRSGSLRLQRRADSGWGQPRTSAAAQLDAKRPKCPTNGLLANPEFECNGRHRVAALVEPGRVVYLFSGKPADPSRALDAVAIQMRVDSRAVHAVGDDQLLDAGATYVVRDQMRNLVLSEPPLPLSGRLIFCFDRVTTSRSRKEFSQFRAPPRGVGVTSHYLHSVVEEATFCLGGAHLETHLSSFPGAKSVPVPTRSPLLDPLPRASCSPGQAIL